MKNLKIVVALMMIICVAVSAAACSFITECEHADKNLDHKCDSCSESMGECADADKDHDCDYGCDKAFGTHKETAGKHTCDYCGEVVSTCADGDKNHKCDVCSADVGTHEAAEGKHTCDYCSEVVNTCTDPDTDHKCDVCGADVGTHEAAEGKHTCDYCGEVVNTCTDPDTDHKCDVCGADVGTHEAAEGKHTCDYCGEVVNTCTDTDTDHRCDVCGADVGTHEAAEGKHTCDYCNEKVSDCTPEEDDNDCSTAILCSVCDAVLTPAKSHDFTGEWQKDADGHWHICKNENCNVTDTKADHISGGAATETEAEKCTECDYIIATELGHQHSYATAKFDANSHWLECSCGEKSAVTAHTANKDDGNCTTAVTCTGCEYIMKAAETEHKAGEKSHNCAACGTKLSDCADNNNDHDCDVCGTELSQCADNSNDHNCDLCGDVLSTCEGNYDEGIITTPATCIENGVKTYTCTVCGETKTEDVLAAGHALKVVVSGEKTLYESGESFDTSKLALKLDCTNCDHAEEVTEYSLSKGGALEVGDEEIIISCVKDEATYTASVQINVTDSLAYPTEGTREENLLYKGDAAYSFMAIDPAGNTDRAAAKGWFTPTVGTNLGLPTLMNAGAANQYLQFNKTAQIELFFNKSSDGKTYHIFDNKTNWGVAAAHELFNKEYTYEFEVSANGAFVLSVCDFRTNMGAFIDNTELYGIDFLFEGNTIKMSRCSSKKVEAIATIEGVDFSDGTTRKISFAIVRQDLDNGKIRVFVDEEKAMFEATADYGSTTVSTNPTPGGKVVNGTLHFPDAYKYGQRFTVAPQALGDGYSTVNIYSYKKLFVKDYTDNQCTVTLDGGLKFADGSTTKVVDKYYDIFANVDLTGYNGLYNVNTGNIFYGLITADVTLGGYVKDANDVVPTLQQFATKGETGLAGNVTKQTNYIVAGRVGTRLTYTEEFTKDYKIRFCDTLANGNKFTGGVTYVSTFTIKNYSNKQLSFTLYEITSGHTLTNFKTHVDLAPGESGTYTIEWSFASANNMLPFIVFDNDHTGDNAGFDFGIALNVVEKK